MNLTSIGAFRKFSCFEQICFLKVTVLGVSKVTKVLLGVFVGQGLAAADPELIQESSITEMDSGLFERSIEGNSFKCTDELACSGKKYNCIVHIIIAGGGRLD